MKTNNRTFLATTLAGALLTVVSTNSLRAQTPPVDPASHAAHVASGKMPPMAAPDTTRSDASLSQQLAQSQAKVAQLQATLAKDSPMLAAATPMPGMPAAAPAAPSTPAPAMSMGDDKMSGGAMPATPAAPMSAAPAPAPINMMGMMSKMMGMMDKMMPAAAMSDDKMGGGAMPAPASAASMPSGMGMMAMDKSEMVGMMGMSPMASKGSTTDAMPPSALPGFPGASHLYHIGSTGFFLDHSQHITLSTEQQAGLNKIKEQAALGKSTADRAGEQAEQALWTLTAADQPDAAKIKAKILEITALQTDERLAFIRSVGDASKLLTDDQRKILTGFAPPAPTPAAMPMPAATAVPDPMAAPAMAPMSDM